MSYHIACQCGHDVPVEIWQCGSTVACPLCHADVRVPDSITLQEQAGDKHPLLSSREKFLRAVRFGEAPFDGRCHGCDAFAAEVSVPISLEIMAVREVQREGTIRPTLSGGLSLKSSQATETWNSINFPLLLCQGCYDRFERDTSRLRQRRYAYRLVLLILFLGFLWFAYHRAELIASMVGLFSLIGGIAWIALQRRKSKLEPELMAWLGKIRWFSETIEPEEEFVLHIGKPMRFMKNDHNE